MKINHTDFIIGNNPDIIYYTSLGSEDFLDSIGNPVIKDGSSDKIYAKAILNRKSRELKTNTGINSVSYRYYIKVNPECMPYNTKKLHTVDNNNKLSFVDKKCKDGWFFKEVSRSVFDKYLTFLRTQSTQLLKEIQRDIK
jgi:hypothetical protein